MGSVEIISKKDKYHLLNWKSHMGGYTYKNCRFNPNIGAVFPKMLPKSQKHR